MHGSRFRRDLRAAGRTPGCSRQSSLAPDCFTTLPHLMISGSVPLVWKQLSRNKKTITLR
jgi:hypothetical protein